MPCWNSIAGWGERTSPHPHVPSPARPLTRPLRGLPSPASGRGEGQGQGQGQGQRQGGSSASLLPSPACGRGRPRSGRVRGSAGRVRASAQRLVNRLQHTLPIPHHLVIPNAQNPPTFRLEKTVPPPIARAIGVLSPIKLDDEAMLDRSKIGDKRTERHLSTKLDATETSIAKQSPHDLLGLRRVAAKPAGKVSLLAFPHD
jgi:hypothetical protein